MFHFKPKTDTTRRGPRRFGSTIVGSTRKGRVARLGSATAIAVVLAGGQVLAAVPADAATQAIDTTSPLIAFPAEGYLWTKCTTSASPCGAGQTAGPYATNSGLTIAAGTSPAVTFTEVSGDTYEEAFQGGNGNLWIRGSLGTEDLGLAMQPGTSPAISSDGGTGGGVAIAFQTAGGTLDRTVMSAAGAVTTTATGLPMDTKSSPAIAGLASGYEVAYQTNFGHLATTGSAGVTTDTFKIMRAGTNPSITKDQNGNGYEVAFQGNDDNLQTTGTLGTQNFGLPMDQQSSPSIVNLTPTTYEIAYQTNFGHLATYASSTGVTTDTFNIMRAGTTPSITGFTVLLPLLPPSRPVPVQEFEVAYQTNTGILDYDVNGTSNVSTGLGMTASPASANSFRYLP